MTAARYPPLSDYGLISDCRSAALVSRSGSIDWCCMPRFDSGSHFGRLLDWEKGGYCSIEPIGEEAPSFQEYVEGTMVLSTTFQSEGGEARLVDCFLMPSRANRESSRWLLRVVEGQRGHCEFRLRIAPRFDYGAVRPWIRRHDVRLFSAIGGDDAIVVSCDVELEQTEDHALEARCAVRGGERVRLLLRQVHPEEIDREPPQEHDPSELDRELDRTASWWRSWSSRGRLETPEGAAALRSAILLKALSYDPTGAILGAPTTSLPEAQGGDRNWDYRYSWVRDSTFSAGSLAELGYQEEAEAFRRFIERSAAGHADDLQVVYGVGGERRLPELEIHHLEGYREAAPVRVGNAATGQRQLDGLGELVHLSWYWHRRGHDPDDDYWRFLLDLVDTAVECWREPDHSIWEWRGEPRHFVYSKVMCWAAVDRGLRLAEECMRKAPVAKWRKARREIKEAVEQQGYDRKRGVFVQSFGSEDLDAALLLLPTVDFVAWEDERMVRTVDAVRAELDEGGLIRRYSSNDELKGREGAFVAGSFWLSECLARQGRIDEARDVFDRALASANHLGLFAEQYDPERSEMLGNFPQALSHYAHISAALALAERRAGSGAHGEEASPGADRGSRTVAG
jgi:GH15 family glucan-1,4-alpha-glucosidase